MMVALTGETFPEAMLERAQLRDEYFGPDGKCNCLSCSIMGRHSLIYELTFSRRAQENSE
jgi:hypothetical protein